MREMHLLRRKNQYLKGGGPGRGTPEGFLQ